MHHRHASSPQARAVPALGPTSALASLLLTSSLALSSCCCPCDDHCGLGSCSCDSCEKLAELPAPPEPAPQPPPPVVNPSLPPGPTPTPPNLQPPDPQPEPLPPGTGANLGIAVYPASASKFDATMFSWTAKSLTPQSYRMGYALGEPEQKSVRASHHAFAKRTHHSTDDGEIFRWIPPPGCGDGLGCVFDQLVARNRPDVRPIAERFRSRAQQESLDANQVAALIVSFVQAIRYEVPKSEPFGVLPPALVAAESWGDCDSKSLLALMLLRDLGIPGIMISSSFHRHTMIGIPMVASGKHFSHGGRRYAFTECTAVGAPIGYIDSKLERPNDWRVVPLKL